MKRENSILKILVLIFGIMFLTNFITAITLDQPRGTISGATFFNVTATAGADGFSTGVYNCTFYSTGSSSTANSTTFQLFPTVSNASTNVSILNQSIIINASQFQDANDYGFYASCMNLTSIRNSSTVSNIIVNNSVPDAPTSIYPTNNLVNRNGSLDFQSTVIGRNTTSCRLYFVNGPNFNGASQSMTHSTNSCSLSLTGVPAQIYNFIIEASDGNETANSSTTTVNVDIPTSAGRSMTPQQITEAKLKSDESLFGKIPIWMIIVVVVIIVLSVIARRK